MNLENLKPAQKKKARKRVGRGIGSGTGKTATRGTKGQNARSGGGVRPGFEGGQMPLFRRLPKRGFTNIFKKEYSIINLGDLNIFEDGTKVDLEMLKKERLIRKNTKLVKVLSEGELNKKLEIEAHKFSKAAKEQIEKLGGSAKVVENA